MDDIKTVQGKAVLKRIAMKVELVLEIEFIVPETLRRRWLIGRKEVNPNKISSFFIKRWFYALFRKSKSESVQEVYDSMYGEKNRAEEYEEEEESSWRAFMDKCNELSDTVKQMQIEQKEIKEMLQKINSKLGIAAEAVPQAES